MTKTDSEKIADSEKIVKQENESIVDPQETILNLAQEHDDERLLTLAGELKADIAGIEEEKAPTISNILIRQKMSENDAMPSNSSVGDMFDTDGELIGTEIEFIPILTHRTRKKWTQGDGANQIDCMSLDGKMGTKYGKCEECPYASFDNGPPPCSPGFTFYGVTNELNKLYRIDFLKTNAKAGRVMRRLARPPALWAKSFTITAQKEKSSQGFDYYQFSVKPSGKKIEGYLFDACKALHAYYKDMYDKALEYQYATAQKSTATPTNDDFVPEVSEGDEISFDDSM